MNDSIQAKDNNVAKSKLLNMARIDWYIYKID